MFKVCFISSLFCVLLFSPVYGVRFEVIGSGFAGQMSGYAGDQPQDDPNTPEHEEDLIDLEDTSLNIDTMTSNSSQTVRSERSAYAQAEIDGCALRATYNIFTRTASYGDGSTDTKGRTSIGFPASGGPNARFKVVLEDEPSHMPFIAHLKFEMSLHNSGSGASAGLLGYNNEILVQLTRDNRTTTIYSHPVTDLSGEGTSGDFYSSDIIVYEDDIISIYGGTETRLTTTVNGHSYSYADLFINLELDPDECPADIAEDYLVNMEDFAVFANYWNMEQGVPFPTEGVVDTSELMWMVDWWLWENTVGCPVPEYATPLVLNKEYRATTNGEGSHWYQFTPGAQGQYSFELLCCDFDPVLSIYEPNATEGYDLVHSIQSNLLICNLVEDKPYYLEIAGWDGVTGTYILKMISGVIAPPNDLCSHPADIAMEYGEDWVYGWIDGRTYGATGQDETSDCGQEDVLDVWYSVTLPMTGDYYITLSGQDDAFMGTLAIFDGIGFCPGTMLKCAELTCPWDYVDILYSGQANETIIVRAGSSVLAPGKFGIAVNLTAPDQ